jgi:hypothetical protein
MFISHLTFILSTIGFLLLIIKSYRQTDFERFLTLFSFLYFSLTGMWLYLNFYTNSNSYLFDLYGVVSENITLLVPVLIVYLFNRKVGVSAMYKHLGFILLLGIVFFCIHYFVASDSENKVIFSISNKNLIYNVSLQLVYDVILFVFFLIRLKKIKSDSANELFDGTYKKVFSILFIAYYSQDILYFVMVLVSIMNANLVYGEYVTLFLNLLVSVLIITLAVYTNWLSLLNRIKGKLSHENLNSIKEPVLAFDVKSVGNDVRNWNDFKQYVPENYHDIIQEIEQLDFLSKTEKLYAALQPFELSHKEIAIFLNVSLRTVGTNFYRLRIKLKEINRSCDYPYSINK